MRLQVDLQSDFPIVKLSISRFKRASLIALKIIYMLHSDKTERRVKLKLRCT